MPLKILIVDDEWQSRSLIRKLLDNFFPGFVIKESDGVASAMKSIEQDSPDIIFLDVQMKEDTGFDLLDKIPAKNFEIIFITAYSEFAIKAFRYSAIDFLLKPVDTEEFKLAVKKTVDSVVKKLPDTKERISNLQQQLKQPKSLPNKLTIPTVEGFLLVPIADIQYCKAISNYTEFHLINHQKLLSSHTLSYYNELLEDQHFFRIHRSYLVNLAHIKMYKRGDGGIVVMDDGEEIEVSRSNKESFLTIFKG